MPFGTGKRRKSKPEDKPKTLQTMGAARAATAKLSVPNMSGVRTGLNRAISYLGKKARKMLEIPKAKVESKPKAKVESKPIDTKGSGAPTLNDIKNRYYSIEADIDRIYDRHVFGRSASVSLKKPDGPRQKPRYINPSTGMKARKKLKIRGTGGSRQFNP